MSTIAARAHSGSTLSAPVRRAAPKRRKQPLWSRVLATALRRPGRALLVLSFTGIAGAILLNAVLLQKTRHPAPMATAPSASQTPAVAERRAETPANPVAPAATPAATTVSAPIPPTRPSDFQPVAREAQVRPPAAVTSVPRSAPSPAPVPVQRAAAPRDPIADLINGVDMRPPAEVRGGVARAASARRPGEN